jgi:group I intron endonuclease
VIFQAYTITHHPSGKVYVGITSRTLKQRWNEHIYESRRGRVAMTISRAIAQHGAENFCIEPICSARSWKDLCQIEKRLIEQFGSLAPHGYNLREGGEGAFGAQRSAESIERSAAKHRGKPCHPNTREASRRTHLGKPKSIETRARMSAAQTGTIRTSATREKISAAKMGKSCNAGISNGQAKLTEIQVREARKRLATGESQRSIARSFGIHFNAIWKIANGIKWQSVI